MSNCPLGPAPMVSVPHHLRGKLFWRYHIDTALGEICDDRLGIQIAFLSELRGLSREKPSAATASSPIGQV